VRKQKADKTGKIVPSFALDPLLAALAHFNTSDDLRRKISSLFQVCMHVCMCGCMYVELAHFNTSEDLAGKILRLFQVCMHACVIQARSCTWRMSEDLKMVHTYIHIHTYIKVLDIDDSGTLSYVEFV
jgi:hypothetical protein